VSRRAGGRIRSPFVAVAALAAVLGMGIPAAVTSAYLTAQGTATASSSVGDWCTVPSPSGHKNVYRLSDFTSVNAPDAGGGSTAVRMLILPVVNDGSYAPVQPVPGGTAGQVGARLWSCTEPMSASDAIKLTSWRGAYGGTQSFNWTVAPGGTVSFPQARLAATGALTNAATTATTSPGAELRDLHRGVNHLGGQSGTNADPVTMRYSWLLTSGRTKGADYRADPVCAAKTCQVTPGAGVTGFGNVFSGDDDAPAANAVSGNSATYLAEKYYADGGVWPQTTTQVQQLQCRSRTRLLTIIPFGDWGDWEDAQGSSCPANTLLTEYESRTITKNVTADAAPTAVPTVLQPAGAASVDSLLRDTTGTKIQWVVLEWWGSDAPPADLEVEVFVV